MSGKQDKDSDWSKQYKAHKRRGLGKTAATRKDDGRDGERRWKKKKKRKKGQKAGVHDQGDSEERDKTASRAGATE